MADAADVPPPATILRDPAGGLIAGQGAVIAEPALDGAARPNLHVELPAEPCVLVIFGATGDLTHRKLLPALYNLAADRRLPAGTSIVGCARRPLDDERFRAAALAAMRAAGGDAFQPAVAEELARGIRYVAASFDDPDGYAALPHLAERLDRERGTRGNRLYYLATPPTSYPTIVRRLGAAGQARAAGGWTRLVVEKPFGRDLESARALNRVIGDVFQEHQVYRIDHYLGKEAVQNILVFRFANSVFEAVWNRRDVDHVQITAAESLGIEGRGAYYEESGALRDMIANHLLQVLALVAMEPPIALDADAFHDEKAKVLRAIRPLDPTEVVASTVRGQYGAGRVDGRAAPGYRQEARVAPDSAVETFVALKLCVDTWRWAGVPFYLRTGKRLARRATEVVVRFKRAPELLFTQVDATPPEANTLRIRIQPNASIALRVGTKVLGPGMHVRAADLDFGFGAPAADAYERLLLDVIQGNPALFTRSDEVEAAWRVVTSILEGWGQEPLPAFPNYPAGSWGPATADELLARDGRRWVQP